MPRQQVTERTVYSFCELDDQAKERAREWYRQGALDYQWWDGVYDDFKRVAPLVGVTVDGMYFTGFWSQGDGACFEGTYSYARGSVQAVREHCPEDSEVIRIARELFQVQARNFYRITASVGHSGHYYHEHCTRIEVDQCSAQDQELVADLLRDLMRWLYSNLERECDWIMSDEQVDLSILDGRAA